MLNPTDPLTKWLIKAERKRHYLFLNGYHMEALELWLQGTSYKSWKPKKIEAVAKDAPNRPKEAVEYEKAFADKPKKKPIVLPPTAAKQLHADVCSECGDNDD